MGSLAALLGLIPYLVAGIETIVKDKQSGAAKKKMALDALQVATAASQSGVLSPSDAALANATSSIVSQTIDVVANTLKSNGVIGTKTAISASLTPATASGVTSNPTSPTPASMTAGQSVQVPD